MVEVEQQQQQQGKQGKPVEAPSTREQHSDEVIAASRFSQRLIEQKERELHESIAVNYTRIRDVEKELRQLQMQVKLTAEPKKQALELLRSKIETQNIKVQAVRRRHAVAKQTYDQLQAELDHEEALKQQLCDELNQLVTTSVSCQLERFEQLKGKLEALHGGAGGMARSSSAPAQQGVKPPQNAAAAAGGVQAGCPDAQPHPAGYDAGSQPSNSQQQQQQQGMQAQQPQLPVSTAASTTAAGADAQAAAAAAAAAAVAAEAEAEAARARHVQLPGRTRHSAAGPAAAVGVTRQPGTAGVQQAPRQQQQAGSSSRQQAEGDSHVSRDSNGRFAGFQ